MDVALSSRAYYGRLGAIGLAGGLFSGLLGVGGGVVMVPLLVLWGGYGQRDAHAVSLGAIIPISAAGVLRLRRGRRDSPLGGAGTGGGVDRRSPGSAPGWLARADERKLKLAFGVFMLIVAAFMVVGR